MGHYKDIVEIVIQRPRLLLSLDMKPIFGEELDPVHVDLHIPP